eukprot:TRINITY_DN16746_c0_g1_i1.p1 TRINITY_DN16746_c0_g1~~TRINITY_DN16746_c0_g1_i1.p1  ORF type:complete len:284 (-),score=-3.35 TRINITY_DN16746_c0_g1_i1:44-895(-)
MMLDYLVENMRDDALRTEELLDLLEVATKLEVVREFLRTKDVPHSAGSWKLMREKLNAYLSDGSITIGELVQLLTLAEECGDQHIFLYFCSKATAAELLDRGRVNPILQRKGLTHLLTTPEIRSLPEQPTIVDVRWATDGVDQSLTIKEVESHTRRKLLKNTVFKNHYYRIYTNEQVRAVNVAKLHRNGLLEIRVQSRDNTTKYDADVLRFFRQIGDIFPMSEFKEISLTKAKDTMWSKRAELGHLLRYTNASICDEEGNTLSCRTAFPEDRRISLIRTSEDG